MTESLPPRMTLSLNGQWQVEPGAEEDVPRTWHHRVPVPSLVDCASPEYEWNRSPYHWYRTTFGHSHLDRYERVVLRINQAMFGTEARIDGSVVGADIACYTSQEYDIRDALRDGPDHELVLRVGAKDTLPPHSAVGNDREKQLFIPGVWGDVSIECSGNPRVAGIQVIPHIDEATAEVRITLDNNAEEREVTVTAKIVESKSRVQASDQVMQRCAVAANGETSWTLVIALREMHLWSPETPFLYEAEVQVSAGGATNDLQRAVFGMRDFRIIGRGFYLNNQRIFLRGGNIAFHRFLSDADRGTLPWDAGWIRKLLIDIPRAHHFNFFRNHLGQLYNRWYDIADEYGMLIQNEWQFWTTSGSKDQIEKEFTRWLRDNWNHPSIIIWDALNESSDAVVQGEIVPRMKELDPTRPWESVDVVEDHPYIYSLGPVLNPSKFGFTRSLEAIENSPGPTVVNEFLWWWLDKDCQPAPLTREVVERWLGRSYTQQDLLSHQSFLAGELVELFRRLQVDAIQPFVYLSNNAGPTGNWFLGDISELRPKPILKALRNAFSPVGISVELWDRHFTPGEQRTVRLFLFNDTPLAREAAVRYGITGWNGEWVTETRMTVTLPPVSSTATTVALGMPTVPASYVAVAELSSAISGPAVSRKVVHVVKKPVAGSLRESNWLVLDHTREITSFFSLEGIPFNEFAEGKIHEAGLLVVVGKGARENGYRTRLREVSEFVRRGGTVVFQEPEVDIGGTETIELLEGLEVTIERRIDADKGGYDSFVFAENHSHPLWDGLSPEHLKFFNGALGGEIVSQHSLVVTALHNVLARCGMNLAVVAAAEIPYGLGLVLVSRLQVRGRLLDFERDNGLYQRRVDPVAQRYFLNLLRYAASQHPGPQPS